MPLSTRLLAFLAGPALALCALPAQARTFCCDTGGQTYCDEGLPPACYGKAYRELGNRGQVVRFVEAPLTPEQRAKRDAELAKKREEEDRLREEDRRNRKLVGTYPTLKELDDAQSRKLEDLQKGIDQAKKRLLDIQNNRKRLNAEAEFYKKKPMPENLKAQIVSGESEQVAQEAAILERQSDLEATRLRFTEERNRYIDLTTKNRMGPR